MSNISDLHLGIYEYNDKKDKHIYSDSVTGSKENSDISVVDETAPVITDTENNTDYIENAGNPLLKALLQKAKDNQIEVCVKPEPKREPEKWPFNLAKTVKEYNIRTSMPAIVAGLNQPVSIDMKMVERKHKLRQTLKKTPKKNQDIVDFCHSISATPQSANSFKHIYSMKRSERDNPKLMLFYNQSVNLDTGANFRTAQIGFKDIRTITFHTYLDWYITKNSFVGNIRKRENLFSFDNIVIDVDNHSGDIKTRTLNREVEKLIACLKEEDLDFPEFNAVYTGRGVQIWIGLVSFTARNEKMKSLYTTFCEKLCDIVKKAVEYNGLRLEVDEGASKDMCRFVRLPYTTNTKARKKARFEKFTDRRYTVDELCNRFNIKIANKDRKKEPVTPKKSGINYSMDFTPLLIKRMNFIEKIVANCNGDCVGRREVILHHYFNVCRQLFNDEKATEMTEQLNMQFSDTLQVSTLMAIFREKIYSYQSATFLSGINATFEERKLYLNMTSRQSERDKAKKAKEERNQKIVELREKGCTQQQIADTVNCHVDTVANVLKKYKPEIKQETAKNTDDTKKLKPIKPVRKDVENSTIELYKQGYKQKEIAKKLGIAESTVSEILKPCKKVELSPRDLEIIQLHKQGLSKAEIAKQVGCSRPTVYSVLNAYNDNTVTVPAEEEPTPEDFLRRIEKIQRVRIERMLNIPIDQMFESETGGLSKGFTGFKKQ